MLLTVVLVLGAAGGLGAVVGWGWSVVWVCGVIGGMGGCGWWLIGLQKYKKYGFYSCALDKFLHANLLCALVKSMDRGIRRDRLSDGNGNSYLDLCV